METGDVSQAHSSAMGIKTATTIATREVAGRVGASTGHHHYSLMLHLFYKEFFSKTSSAARDVAKVALGVQVPLALELRE